MIPLFLLLIIQSANADSLKNMIQKSLQTHPSVGSQALRVKSSELDIKTAKWQFYPTLGLEFSTQDKSNNVGDRSFSDSFRDFGNARTTIVSLEQPLWTGGRLKGGLDRATANLQETQEGLGQLQRELALNIVQAYGNWLAADLRVKSWQETLETHISLKKTVNRRLEEGLASNSDQLLADSRLTSVRAELTAAQAEVHVALSSLSQLVGDDIENEDLSIELVLPVLEEDLITMIGLAMELSPDVQRSLAQVELARADVSIQKSQSLPTLFLRMEYEFGKTGVERDSFSDSAAFIGVRTALGAGLSAFSGIDSSHAAYQASLAAVDVQRLAIKEQVQGDYYLVSSFAARLDALKQSEGMTEAVFESYNRQFLSGRKTWFDLLNSARDLAQSKVQLADAESAYLVVTWRLAIFTQALDSLLEGEG